MSTSNLPTVDGPDRLCVSERAQCVPSRVLHLRRLPADVSEQDVLALALPFGRVNKLITLKTKNQVFSLTYFVSQQANVSLFSVFILLAFPGLFSFVSRRF